MRVEAWRAVAEPVLSVVIPTRRRETRLAFALEALATQDLEGPLEVVVVRDGRWDGPRVPAPPGLEVRFAELDRRLGPAGARNAGWRAATGPLVAFTDDDCRPAPGWAAALAAAARGEDVFVQGRTEPDPDERHLLGGLSRSQSITGPTEAFQTCNMAYPRVLLERLGGFDGRFEAGEDTELAWRARAAGARAVFAGDALAWHAVHPRNLPAALGETWRWRHVPRLIARHPEQRGLLRYGLFWKESHARIALAAAGALAARRVPLAAVAAAIPYVARHARGYESSPRGIARAALDLPSLAAVDAAETAVTVAGAVREGVWIA